MNLLSVAFPACGLLVEFVNTNSILQVNIQKILISDGQWYLYYWG